MVTYAPPGGAQGRALPRLLVSVRAASEVHAALRGGADILDAKEPSAGPLGRPSAGVLAAIAAEVPDGVPFSVALGDLRSPVEARAVVRRAAGMPGGPRWLKAALAEATDAAEVERVARAGASAVAEHAPTAGFVLALYADRPFDPALATPAGSARLAAAGVAGVLVDTASKHGERLVDRCALAQLVEWVGCWRDAGLLVALAGRLDAEAIARLRPVAPDILGVRGAACDGGRDGHVSEARVRALRDALGYAPSSAGRAPASAAASSVTSTPSGSATGK